jgi:hypothetical protein
MKFNIICLFVCFILTGCNKPFEESDEFYYRLSAINNEEKILDYFKHSFILKTGIKNLKIEENSLVNFENIYKIYFFNVQINEDNYIVKILVVPYNSNNSFYEIYMKKTKK